jgi:hypothetical protein
MTTWRLRVLPIVCVLALGGRAEADQPPCCESPPAPYPRDAGRAWYWMLGPFGGFRTDRDGRLHAGAELSLMSGRRTDDGAHASPRGLLFGGLLDVGYLSAPNALRASLEAQVAHCMTMCGLSLGPTVTVTDASTRVGGAITLWYGYGAFLYARVGTDLPYTRYAEIGLFMKVPLNLR